LFSGYSVVDKLDKASFFKIENNDKIVKEVVVVGCAQGKVVVEDTRSGNGFYIFILLGIVLIVLVVCSLFFPLLFPSLCSFAFALSGTLWC